MRWFAQELGFDDDADFWGVVGLLHDIDFEEYPEEHCIKAPEILREAGVDEDIIHGCLLYTSSFSLFCKGMSKKPLQKKRRIYETDIMECQRS